MTTVEIILDDKLLLQLALEAHRQDITLNQLIVNILTEAVKTYGYNEDSESDEDYLSSEG